MQPDSRSLARAAQHEMVAIQHILHLLRLDQIVGVAAHADQMTSVNGGLNTRFIVEKG